MSSGANNYATRIQNRITRFRLNLRRRLLRYFNAASLDSLDNINLLLDRERVRTDGSRWERIFFHKLSAYVKAEAIAERKKLGKAFLQQYRGTELDIGLRIDKDSGLLRADLSAHPVVQQVIAEGRKIAASIEAQSPSKGSLVFLASSSRNIDASSPISDFARSPLLLLPIIEYFGMLPILFGFDINRAQSGELLDWSSQLYHLDPEDVTQIKVFLPLVDVDHDTRPFTALPADLSAKVIKAYDHTVGRLPDKKIEAVIGKGKGQASTGPAGSITFCDTNRCFHYGGRPGKNIRDMLTLYYTLPTSTWFPLHGRDGERRNLTPFLTPRADSPFDKALLGHELIF